MGNGRVVTACGAGDPGVLEALSERVTALELDVAALNGPDRC